MQLVIQISIGFGLVPDVATRIFKGIESDTQIASTITRQVGKLSAIRFEFLQEIVGCDTQNARIRFDPHNVEVQNDAPRRIIRIISDLGWINDQIANAVCCAVPGEYSLEVCDLRLSSTRESGPSSNFFSTPPRTGVPFYPKPTTLLIETPPQAFHHED